VDRKRKLVSFIRRNRGQAVIEFALVLPLLLIILFGIVEFARAWMTVSVLTSAAREGARLAAVTAPDVNAVTIRVNEVCSAAGLTVKGVTVTPPDSMDPTRRLTVTVESDFTVLLGELLGTFKGTIPLRATSVMRHESI
jgi:Flp pilus assembly protein TadG